MPSFHSRFQQAILDGRVALWMLAGLPLVFRGLVFLLPQVEDADAGVLGTLLVVGVGVRLYTTIVAFLLDSTRKERWDETLGVTPFFWSSGVLCAYYYLTSTLPLAAAISIDIAASILIILDPTKRAAALLVLLVRSSQHRRW